MVTEDDEIEDSRLQEQALTVPARRAAAERRRILKKFSNKLLKALKAKDGRAYAELLSHMKIKPGSEEWKNAWKQFSSD